MRIFIKPPHLFKIIFWLLGTGEGNFFQVGTLQTKRG
nr:MAG TPA: hypothetical protein [Caudoviricetes sp.]DAS15411.1 MAG TPA: hypothetical protein [Caudoviricetes sp.]DAY07819.1 MAG TPA: hypothetical protein [Caudoviricetes sp.]